MPQYCLVINGSIGAPASLPRDYQGVSNFYTLPPTDLARYGWYPFNSATPPSFTESTQKLVESLTFTGTQVNQSWQVVNLTQDEQIAFATARLQAIGQAISPYLDSQVANRQYDSIISATSWNLSNITIYKQEGAEATAFRDTCWSQFNNLVAGVQAGTTPLPTVNGFLASLPKLWAPPAPPPDPGNGTSNGTSNITL
jgi:hypothetical protein